MYKEIKTFYEAITWSSLWIVGQGVSRQENTMAKLGLPLKDLLHLYILFSEWKPLGDTLGNNSFHPFHMCAEVMERLSLRLFQALSSLGRADDTRLKKTRGLGPVFDQLFLACRTKLGAWNR